jgi:hypothetical protein
LSLESIKKTNAKPFIPTEDNNKKRETFNRSGVSPRKYYMGKVATKLVPGFFVTTR